MSRWARTTTTTKTGFSSVLYLRTDSAQKSPITCIKLKELVCRNRHSSFRVRDNNQRNSILVRNLKQ
jgi:hypothetical protein